MRYDFVGKMKSWLNLNLDYLENDSNLFGKIMPSALKKKKNVTVVMRITRDNVQKRNCVVFSWLFVCQMYSKRRSMPMKRCSDQPNLIKKLQQD